MTGEAGVQVIANSSYYANRFGYDPKFLILHSTAGGTSAVAIANYFRNVQGTSKAVSSHYVIGVDGEIVLCVGEEHAAWGNGLIEAGADPWWDPNLNPNLVSISIEHCKPSYDNHDQLTEAQKQASFKLVRHICERWNIPMRKADASGGITGHFSMAPGTRSGCPGPYPWEELWNYLQGGTDMAVNLLDPVMSRYLEDSGDGKWRVKNSNIQIWGDIRDYYCRYGGVAHFGLPLTSELDNVVTGCKVTVCERAIIIFDPDRRHDNPPETGTCYLMHITSGKGQEYLAQPLVAALNAELDDSEKLVKLLEEKLAQLPGSDYEEIKVALSEALEAVNRYKQAVRTFTAALNTLNAL